MRASSLEALIVIASIDQPVQALNLYRKRWRVECLFADAKTRGFTIKNTHITDKDKLATLLVVTALAITWAYRCATRAMGKNAIRRKAMRSAGTAIA